MLLSYLQQTCVHIVVRLLVRVAVISLVFKKQLQVISLLLKTAVAVILPRELGVLCLSFLVSALFYFF